LDEYFAQLAMKKAQAEKPMVPPAAVVPGRTPTLVGSASDGGDNTTGNAERGLELVLGLRDVPYLLYIDCVTGATRQVSLNENAWDMHVSFAPLSLALSPGGERLLVATDKNMHILLEAGSNRRLQTFSGHSCGAYGKPSVCWSWRGDFVYSNSDDENIVYVYCARSGKIVDRLVGHGKGIVRGVTAHKSKDLVLSASYDKSVILWKCDAVTL
jgi:WD40 repeat protein